MSDDLWTQSATRATLTAPPSPRSLPASSSPTLSFPLAVQLVPIDHPVDLPAPPVAYLSSLSLPLTPHAGLSSSPPLPPPLLLSIYRRALTLYHLPLPSLSWQSWPSTSTPSSLPYYSSLLTSEVSHSTPPHHVPLHPSDYLIRPSPGWFPGLLSLCFSLSLTVRFASSSSPSSLADPYYGHLVTGSSSSLPNLLYTVQHVVEALRVYSRSACERMGLKEVWLVERLSYRGQDGWTALPSLPSGRLYLACERVERVFLLSIIHHELFHFIDHSSHTLHTPSSSSSPAPSHTPTLSPSPITFCAVPDSAWASLNPPSFRYGQGGCSPSSRRSFLSYSGHVPGALLVRGFVDRYAMVAMEEDRAEVWAAMVRDWESVVEAEDEGVRRKGEEVQRRVREWSGGEMDAAWWRRLQRRGGGGSFSLTMKERSMLGRLRWGRWESRRDCDGVEYWHNARTKQSVRINPNRFLQRQTQPSCIERGCLP